MHENKIMQKNQFVVSVKKVYIITISEDKCGNSWKLKNINVALVMKILHTHNQ